MARHIAPIYSMFSSRPFRSSLQAARKASTSRRRFVAHRLAAQSRATRARLLIFAAFNSRARSQRRARRSGGAISHVFPLRMRLRATFGISRLHGRKSPTMRFWESGKRYVLILVSDSGFCHCEGLPETIERVGLFDTVDCRARTLCSLAMTRCFAHAQHDNEIFLHALFCVIARR